jgi:curved DNA-binding protein CbpA
MELPTEKNQYIKHSQTDLYNILNVGREATIEEIKEKYAELLLIYHPDKGGDSEKFKDLQIAYKILSNPKNREIYTKSLSSTYGDIVDEYRDPKTGERKDVGYEVNADDFTKAPTEAERETQREAFMNLFEYNRSDEEKAIIEKIRSTNPPKAPMTFEEIKAERKRLEDDIDVPLIDGLDPQKLDMSLFNQIFEANSKLHQANSKDLAVHGFPEAMRTTGLASLDNQPSYGGLFSSDNWIDDSQQQSFLTYKQPQNVDLEQYDRTSDVTKTRNHNEDDLTDRLNRRMKDMVNERDQLLYMKREDYQVAPEHDVKNDPLSYYNMLGEQFVTMTIDPPKKDHQVAPEHDVKNDDKNDQL